MTFLSVSPYYRLNREAPNEKINMCKWIYGGRTVFDFYFDFIYKIKIKSGCFPLFLNFKILFHDISVRSNTAFYDLGPFIILEPIPPFLFKASNFELYFGIFRQMAQPVSYKTVARLKHYSKNLFLKFLSQKVPATQV